MNERGREFSVSDIVATLLRRWKVMLAVTVAVTAAAAVFSFTLKNYYESSVTLEIGRVLDSPLESPTTLVDRLSSGSVLAASVAKRGYHISPSELERMVEVQPVYAETRERQLTRLIKITVKSDDPKRSAELATAFTDAVMEDHRAIYDNAYAVNDNQVKHLDAGIADTYKEIDRGRQNLNTLAASGQLDQTKLAYLASYVEEKESYVLHLEEIAHELRKQLYMPVFTNPTRITVPPVPADHPAGPDRRRIVFMAFVVSLALAVMVAFVVDRFIGKDNNADVPPVPEKKKELTAPTTPVRKVEEPPARPEPPSPALDIRDVEVNRLPDSVLNLSELWRIIRSQGFVIVITVVLGTALSLVYAFVKPREYEASFVISMGIVGDTWVRSPMLIEERCQSHWFLEKLEKRLNDKYDVSELGQRIQAELITTPTKGLTREVKITVHADSPDACYSLAANLGDLLVLEDQEYFEKTLSIYESYLNDLTRVMDNLSGPGQTVPPEAVGPAVVVPSPPENSDYAGGGQVYSLFSRSRDYTENPYLMTSMALLEQVYIDAYVKTRSPIFSQPTRVVVPPQKPAKPKGPGTISIVLTAFLVSLVFGVTLAAINYRLQQTRRRS